MLKFIKSFFKKPEPVVQEQPASPYKIDAKVEFVPAVETTPVVAEQISQAMVESIAPAKKKPAAKKAPAAKKPRAPKKPKAE